MTSPFGHKTVRFLGTQSTRTIKTAMDSKYHEEASGTSELSTYQE